MILVFLNLDNIGQLIELPENLQLTRNFTLKELANVSGKEDEAQYIISRDSLEFNTMLQAFRGYYGKPIVPTSGYRQPEFNKEIGGVSNSLHLKACACDFVDAYKLDKIFVLSSWLRVLYEFGNIGAINIYNNNEYYRYHVEAFSDLNGARCNEIRVYTSRAERDIIWNHYRGLGVEVKYYGNN